LTVDVPIGWSEVACQADHPNHDEKDGKGIPKGEVTATHLVEEEQYAERDKNRGTHQAANRTTLAMATNAITHPDSSLSTLPLMGGPIYCET
jgi:hypothetical protein